MVYSKEQDKLKEYAFESLCAIRNEDEQADILKNDPIVRIHASNFWMLTVREARFDTVNFSPKGYDISCQCKLCTQCLQKF